MANTRLPMRKIKEALRLNYQCRLSRRQIAGSLDISRSTVADYIDRAEQAGIGWPLPEGLSDQELERRLFPLPPVIAGSARPLPDCEYIYQELKAHKKFNLTLDLLWREYKEQHPDGYQYSQFCWLYRSCRLTLDRVCVNVVLIAHRSQLGKEQFMKQRFRIVAAAGFLLLGAMTALAQNLPGLNMGYSGAGIGSDLLKVIDRSGLWRKYGLDVKVVYLTSGTLMAQTMSSGDISVAGFDTPAMLNLALAGTSLKIVAVAINRLEPFFIVRNDIKVPADLKGKKIAISRFGSGSDIITRVALRYWKLDADRDVSLYQSGNTPTRIAALVAGHMDGGLVSSTGVARILATGCCRVLADLSELPLEYANYSVVVSGTLLKNQRENIRHFLQAITAGIWVFKTRPDIAKSVLKESNNDADVAPLYERLTKSLRDYPVPEPNGIQNVLEFMPAPKARGAQAEDFMDTSLMEEIRKSGFIDRLYAGKE